MNPAPSRRNLVSTRAVTAGAVVLLVAGAGLTLVASETKIFDPLWGAVTFGCGFGVALYGAVRTGIEKARPAVEVAAETVQRGLLISKRNTLIAQQRRTEAIEVQGHINKLTAKLYPKERERLTTPPPPPTMNKRKFHGGAR